MPTWTYKPIQITPPGTDASEGGSLGNENESARFCGAPGGVICLGLAVLGGTMGRKGSSLIGRMLKRGGESRERATAIIQNLAIEHQGHRLTMAAELGVSEVTLWRWCQAYGIDVDAVALSVYGDGDQYG